MNILLHKKKLFCLSILLGCLFINQYSYAQLTVVQWDFPNNPDNSSPDSYSPNNASATLTSNALSVMSFANAGATTNCASITGWQNGSGVRYWEAALTTLGIYNMNLSFALRSNADAPMNWRIDYKIGAAAWVTLPGASAIVVADDFTTGAIYNLQLPSSLDNRTTLRLRWVMTNNISVSNGTVLNTGISYMDDISLQANYLGYFRSIQSGNWDQSTTWQSSIDSITWAATNYVPNYFAKDIVIQSGHNVTVQDNIIVDNIYVNNGGSLTYTSGLITVADGAGCDFNVLGTFYDDGPFPVHFDTNATWQLGANGTFVKISNSSASLWQTNYYNNISNVPVTAHWIIRRMDPLRNPPISTSPGSVTGSYYPNLTIENDAPGFWNIDTIVASAFNGFLGYPIIKGNFDIGGNGSGLLNFYNQQTCAQPTIVLGDLIIRSGNSIENAGTGIELHGNLFADGNIFYPAASTPQFNLVGANSQTINGSGYIQIFDMAITKTANAILNRKLSINHNLTFNGGHFITSLTNLLTLNTGAAAIVNNNGSYVEGPCCKLGSTPFIFPIGKSEMRIAGVDNGGSPSVFWLEDFNNNCSQACNANGYSGINGTWTVTDIGTQGASANKFYISYSENGNAIGQCGSQGGGDATLHIGKKAGTGGCATGDCGATYAWGTAVVDVTTYKRAESPVIDCSGKEYIQLSFKYFEGGSGTLDDANLWYYDGSTWNMINNLAKTSTSCGAGKGLWTIFSINLPQSSANNQNIKIGFSWKNNTDQAGYSTSFAVDDIQLTEPLSITAEYFNANPKTDFGSVYDTTMDDISSCDYWLLTQNAGASTKTVTLSYDNPFCYVTVPSLLKVARYDTVAGNNIWRDLSNSVYTGSNFGTVTAAISTNQFGAFSLGLQMNPLPAELLSFNAKPNGRNVLVNWESGSEPELDYYVVERNSDKQSFQSIAQVAKKGNSTSGSKYEIIDAKPLDGISYYRLREVDINGKIKYSNTVAVKFELLNSNLIAIVNQNLNALDFFINGINNTLATVSIMDVAGRIIISKSMNVQPTNIIDLNCFAKGVYFLTVETEDSFYRIKFVR